MKAITQSAYAGLGRLVVWLRGQPKRDGKTSGPRLVSILALLSFPCGCDWDWDHLIESTGPRAMLEWMAYVDQAAKVCPAIKRPQFRLAYIALSNMKDPAIDKAEQYGRHKFVKDALDDLDYACERASAAIKDYFQAASAAQP